MTPSSWTDVLGKPGSSREMGAGMTEWHYRSFSLLARHIVPMGQTAINLDSQIGQICPRSLPTERRSGCSARLAPGRRSFVGRCLQLHAAAVMQLSPDRYCIESSTQASASLGRALIFLPPSLVNYHGLLPSYVG